MKKRLWSILLLVCMLTTMVPLVETEASAAAESQWLWPVPTCRIVSSNFGYRDLDGNGSLEDLHEAIDIIGASGTYGAEVVATKSGIVITSEPYICPHKNPYDPDPALNGAKYCSCHYTGNYVVIDHEDGTYSRYMHMQWGTPVAKGKIKQGEVVGKIGSSGDSGGPHLHFQIYTNPDNPNGSAYNVMPMNPESEIYVNNKNNYVVPDGWSKIGISYVFEAVKSPEDLYLRDECVRYSSYNLVEVKASSNMKSLPFSDDTNTVSKTVHTTKVGEQFVVTGLYENEYGNYWYETEYNGQRCFIFAGSTVVKEQYWDAEISGENAPDQQEYGKSFSIKGEITSKYGKLVEVGASIVQKIGPADYITFYEETDVPVNNSYSLLNSKIDRALLFGELPEGTFYYYDVYARVCNYTSSDGKTYKENYYTKPLHSKQFTVGKVTVAPPTAELSIDRQYYNVGDDVTFYLGSNSTSNRTLGLYKDGVRLDGVSAGETYTRAFTEPGSYSAYMTTYNSIDSTNSNWVYWEVNEVTAELSASREMLYTGETVDLTFSGFSAGTQSDGGFTLLICKDGEPISGYPQSVSGAAAGTTPGEVRYSYKCSSAGSYSAYMTAYGEEDFEDSNWVYWTVEKKPSYLSNECTLYPSYLTIEVSQPGQHMYSVPTSSTGKGSKTLVENMPVGQRFTAIGLYENHAGNYWYEVEHNGSRGYIYCEDAAVVEYLTDAESFNVSAPYVLDYYKDSTSNYKNPGHYVKGEVSTGHTKLKKVYGYIEDLNGNVLYPTEGTVSDGKKYVLDSSTVDDGLLFSTLSEGDYILRISVGEQVNYAVDNTLKTKTLTHDVWRSRFYVKYARHLLAEILPKSYAQNCTSASYSKSMVTTTAARMMTQPCEHTTDSTSQLLELIPVGTKVTVTAKYTNTAGEVWYQIKYTDVEYKDVEEGGAGSTEIGYISADEICAHSITSVAKKAATCTAAGSKAYYTCKNCGGVFEDQAATKPTTKAAMTIPKLSHSLNYFAEEVSTCTTNGHAAYYQCTNCSKYFTDAAGKTETTWADLVYKVSGHSLIYVEKLEATCLEDGYRAHWACENCDLLFGDRDGKETTTLEERVIKALGHILSTIDAKAPTCTEEGNILYYCCARCYKLFTDTSAKTTITEAQTKLAALDHALNKVEAKDATCTEKGNIAHYICEHCKTYYLDAAAQTKTNKYDVVLEPLDHDYENGVCVRCGDTLEHTWDNGVVTREPLCIADGELTYTCLDCGETRTEAIPKLDHDYEGEVTEPTCTAGGYTTYICSRCGDSYIGDCTDPLEHEYEDGVCIHCGADEGALEAAVAEVVIGGAVTGYDEITEAITALKTTVAADEAVLRLMQDIELAESLVILDSVFTFDLNGHTIHSTAGGLQLARTDMILIDSSAEQTGRITAEAGNGISMAIETKLTVCSGMVEGSNYAIRMPSVNSTVLRQLVITGGTLKSGGVGVVLARDDVRISGGTMLLDGAESDAVYIQQYGGTVSFEGYTGELLGMTIAKVASLTPSVESYHLPAGYCLYKYDEDTGVVGTKPVTVITEYYQSYIIGKLPHVPEELNCTISADKAILRGDELGLYMQLYMAAYDADGRMLAVTDTVEYIDGSYAMTVSAEKITEVRLFVMDGTSLPVMDAKIFE